ncbi:hypothetical protein [Erythrobacter sp.]|jgi:hypothetical protein|uniref:hypothetical protein n=1 Tax=Erythrobacter sp. TaxID=1042 RepID=UPI002EB1CEAF|nr:hypothetical protein [Erythrobacter sp.]
MNAFRLGSHTILGAALIAGAATSAWAATCEPEFVRSAQTISLTASEVGDNIRVEANEQLRVRNTAGGECNAFLRLARLSTSNPDPARAFVVASGGQLLDILPSDVSAASSSSDLFVPGIPGGGSSSRAIPLRFSFPAQWGIASGASSETLLVQLIDETGGVFDELVLTVNLNVLPTVEMRIVGATGSDRIARIDLGALNPRIVNRSDPFGLRVWSTSPYTVTFASSNAGALAHTVAADRIDYEMRAAGRRVDLSGGSPSAFGRRTDGLGDFHPLEISVPPFVSQAGDYSDRVTVTVSAG